MAGGLRRLGIVATAALAGRAVRLRPAAGRRPGAAPRGGAGRPREMGRCGRSRRRRIKLCTGWRADRPGGDWEPDVGDNNKSALMAGMVEAAVSLPADPPPDGEVRWPDGTTTTVRLVSAPEALAGLKADAAGSPCPRLHDIAAHRRTPDDGPGPDEPRSRDGTGLGVHRAGDRGEGDSARGRCRGHRDAAALGSRSPARRHLDRVGGRNLGGQQLTVSFTGAPGPGDQGCGADYTAEAVESSTAVVVIVTEHPHALFEACTAVGATRTAVVELAAPLGERAVLEVKEGLPVPVRLTP